MSARAKGKSPRGVAPVPKKPTSKAHNPVKWISSSIDTSLSSYDRTDPFAALNALRSLLASLPSRMGGCMFKLTPQEHALSLHLLTIVEPFVGTCAASESRRALTRQPTELLDVIVGHIDSRKDLLSLALSCKRLHSVVCPRHLSYRVMRCKVSSLRVWNHLISNRALARNVRVLEILDERSTEPEIVPPDIVGTDTDMESTDDELGMHVKHEKWLVSALGRMTALDSFVWSCNHSPISVDHIWPALLRCTNLKQIEMNDNLLFSDPTDHVEVTASTTLVSSRARPVKQFVLPELKKVLLQSTKHIYGATKTPTLSRISSMLNHCPNLESLSLCYTTPRRGPDYFTPVADDFLLCSRWPYLRTLIISNLWCSPQTGWGLASAFLTAHTNLQILHIDLVLPFGPNQGQIGQGQWVLPPDALPKLRELRSSREFACAVLTCPCSAPGGRPLETLKGVRLSGSSLPSSTSAMPSNMSGADEAFISALRHYGKDTVKRIELAGWNEVEDVRRLVESAPKLQWLDLGKRNISSPGTSISSGSAQVVRNAPAVDANANEWAVLLSPLTELTTFHGVRFFYEVSPSIDSSYSSAHSISLSLSERSRLRKNEEIASVLAWKCPKLRRVDHWEDGVGKVIVLLRDGEKVRWEVRRIKV